MAVFSAYYREKDERQQLFFINLALLYSSVSSPVLETEGIWKGLSVQAVGFSLLPNLTLTAYDCFCYSQLKDKETVSVDMLLPVRIPD